MWDLGYEGYEDRSVPAPPLAAGDLQPTADRERGDDMSEAADCDGLLLGPFAATVARVSPERV
jgi:hypothetical protein